jgi:hypothetical protein
MISMDTLCTLFSECGHELYTATSIKEVTEIFTKTIVLLMILKRSRVNPCKFMASSPIIALKLLTAMSLTDFKKTCLTGIIPSFSPSYLHGLDDESLKVRKIKLTVTILIILCKLSSRLNSRKVQQ